MKYTPGPWRFSKVEYGQDFMFHIQTVDMSHRNTFIGEVGGGLQFNSEIESNARLIAAAPDLLKALESITLSMKAHPDCTEGSEFADMVNIAEKAINKAKGL